MLAETQALTVSLQEETADMEGVTMIAPTIIRKWQEHKKKPTYCIINNLWSWYYESGNVLMSNDEIINKLIIRIWFYYVVLGQSVHQIFIRDSDFQYFIPQSVEHM